MRKTAHLAMAVAVTMALSSCYGPFRLTSKLHKWNGEVGASWVNEGIFLGFALFPVYAVAILGDAVIFNTIEFWGGKNPITAKATKSIQSGDDQAVLSYNPDTRNMRLDNFKKGQRVSTVVLQPGPDGNMVARNGKGELLMSAASDGDSVILKGASGQIIARHNLSELQERPARTN